MLSFIIGCVGLLFSTEYTPDNTYCATDTLKLFQKNKIEIDTSASQIKINRIFIVGNRVTREQIILRELSVKSGDSIYAVELSFILDQDKKKLYNTRLFNTVDIRILELEQDQIDLLISVDERWYTFPVPIFQLSDRNFNEWWTTYNHDFSRVNYGLSLYQYNMRGRNETLKVTAQFGFTRRFELSYRFPYIDKKQKQGLSISMDYSESKNVAFQTFHHKLDFLRAENILKSTHGFNVTYTYRNSFYIHHNIFLDYRSNQVSDTIPNLNPNYMLDGSKDQQLGSIGYQFINDHRDIAAYPLKGYYLQASIQKHGLGFGDDVNKLEVTGSFAKYMDVRNGFYLSNYTTIAASTPNQLAYNYYTALGYRKNFVRGYEIYVIEGPASFLNKTTFKKRLYSKTLQWNGMPIEQFRYIPFAIYLKTYADFGYVPNYPNYETNSRLSNKLLTGAGFGVDIIGSYDAVLRLEYSFNNIQENGFFIHINKEF